MFHGNWHRCCSTDLEHLTQGHAVAHAPKTPPIAPLVSWAAAIADNVRNPVGGVTAALEIIAREIETWRQTGTCDQALLDDSLARSKARLHALADYVAELTDFSKPLAIAPTLLKVDPWLQRLTNALDLARREPFHHRVLAGAELMFADEGKLIPALKALIVNSVEAIGHSQRPSVRLTIQKSERNGTTGTLILLEDNGPGFDPHALERAFEPFYSSKVAGTGLGLSLARRCVAAHQGEIELSRSKDLGGAAIVIFLPDHVPPDAKHRKTV